MRISNRPRQDRKRQIQRFVGNVLFYLLTGVLLAVFMFVFFWMVMTSIKQPKDVTVYPPVWLFQPTLDNYRAVLDKTPFWQQLQNSLIIAVGTLVVGLVLGLPASYSIARFRQRSLALTVLIVRMIPSVVFMLPLFVIYKQFGLIDTHPGLIFSHLILVLPLVVWIMMGFFEDVPVDIEEQARVDGCDRWQAFWRVVLPLSLPGVAVTAILSFLTSWNNFVFVLILGGSRTSTLPMAVFNFMGFEQLDFGGVAAAASLLSLPIIILTLIVQRWLVEGLTMGAVKGV